MSFYLSVQNAHLDCSNFWGLLQLLLHQIIIIFCFYTIKKPFKPNKSLINKRFGELKLQSALWSYPKIKDLLQSLLASLQHQNYLMMEKWHIIHYLAFPGQNTADFESINMGIQWDLIYFGCSFNLGHSIQIFSENTDVMFSFIHKIILEKWAGWL